MTKSELHNLVSGYFTSSGGGQLSNVLDAIIDALPDT